MAESDGILRGVASREEANPAIIVERPGSLPTVRSFLSCEASKGSADDSGVNDRAIPAETERRLNPLVERSVIAVLDQPD
jgi:hypothetical protein